MKRRRGIKSHTQAERDQRCVTDKTKKGSGHSVPAVPTDKEPACLYFATDKDLPLGFSGHLLLKMGLFSLLLQQGNTEELDRHRTFAPGEVQTHSLWKKTMCVGSTTHRRLRYNNFWLTVQVLSFHLVFRWRN